MIGAIVFSAIAIAAGIGLIITMEPSKEEMDERIEALMD